MANQEVRYFKKDDHSGEIIIVRGELEKFAYVGGAIETAENGDQFTLESDMASITDGTIFEPSPYVVNPHVPCKLAWEDGEEFKISDLSENAEGTIYWNGHNWILITLVDDQNEPGWTEITSEMPEINLGKAEAYAVDVKPGIEYTLRKDDKGGFWLEEESRWQGALPWNSLYEVAEEDMGKYRDCDSYTFKNLCSDTVMIEACCQF